MGEGQESKFQFLMDKIQNKLNRWKANSLSFAGRVTLVQAVTQQVPIFNMQHEDIPKGVCKETENPKGFYLGWYKREEEAAHG